MSISMHCNCYSGFIKCDFYFLYVCINFSTQTRIINAVFTEVQMVVVTAGQVG